MPNGWKCELIDVFSQQEFVRELIWIMSVLVKLCQGNAGLPPGRTD